MAANKTEVFGMLKSLTDAHTMGVHAASALLRDCGYTVVVASKQIEDAVDKITTESAQKLICDWVRENKIAHLGISYRLDPKDAVGLVGRVVYILKKEGLYESGDNLVKSIHFAGLKPACDEIDSAYGGRIKTFRGGESAEETLLVMGVPFEDIPKEIKSGCKYDKQLLDFGREIIKSGEYRNYKPAPRKKYKEFGTAKDRVELRLDHNFEGPFRPIIRAHSGPYSPDLTRAQCLKEYREWCRELAQTGLLDVLSIGSSQLSQSNFGEKWDGKRNGGGVPVNSEQEYREIWEAARPMLVRTYSGTKNITAMAEMYERTINISRHALSLWWFNELDGRGPNDLYHNLQEHIDAIRYIATVNKPVETNVPHHFAFRGCDDVTYIVSGYLAAKTAKRCGVKTFILQNMLNTPRSTWGIQDLAKSRVLIKLVNELSDEHFRVILQSRAGLDYFKPDIEEAKVQLAAVTAMMDDIDPANVHSPEIIPVVSYSEALVLATPDILNDSIRITLTSLEEYRKRKRKGETPDVMTDEIKKRTARLDQMARTLISAMEKFIPDLYSPKGLYLAFTAGWLPVPELWSDSDEFAHAKAWGTKGQNGSIVLTDHDVVLTTDARINRCVSFMDDAERYFNFKYRRNAKND